MITLGNAASDMQIDVLVVTLVVSDDPTQQGAPLGIGVWVCDTNTVETILQPVQMLCQTEWSS